MSASADYAEEIKDTTGVSPWSFMHALIQLFHGKQSRPMALFGAAIWLSAGAAILQPEMTIWIAGIFGTGRGADLVLYLLAFSYLLSLFYVYNKFRKIESNKTEIVRQRTLREPVSGQPQARGDPMNNHKLVDDESLI